MKKILLIGLYGILSFVLILIIAILIIMPAYLAKETNNNNWLFLYLPILVFPMVVLLGSIAYYEFYNH